MFSELNDFANVAQDGEGRTSSSPRLVGRSAFWLIVVRPMGRARFNGSGRKLCARYS